MPYLRHVFTSQNIAAIWHNMQNARKLPSIHTCHQQCFEPYFQKLLSNPLNAFMHNLNSVLSSLRGRFISHNIRKMRWSSIGAVVRHICCMLSQQFIYTLFLSKLFRHKPDYCKTTLHVFWTAQNSSTEQRAMGTQPVHSFLAWWASCRKKPGRAPRTT